METYTEGRQGEPEVSVILPCLNESETLAGCISEVRSFFDRSGIQGEIIIGDNGSTDGSQQIAEKQGARVVHVPKRGYGAALMGGFRAARGKYLIMGDSDGSYDLEHLEPFVEKMREGYGVVMGNRFKGKIYPRAMPFKNRYLGNPILTGIGRTLFRAPCGDFHCGLRGISKNALDNLDLQTTGMEFASEMVIKATLNNLPIAEVPTNLRPDGRSRRPHLRPWRDGWRHLRFMLLFSPRWLFFYPGIALLSLGLFLLVAIYVAPLKITGIYLDVNTMVFASASVILSFQSIAFSVFARAIATRLGILGPSRWLDRFSKIVSLEAGLVAGAILLVAGLAGAIVALFQWKAVGFSELNPRVSLRPVILSATSIILGFQLILASFLLGVIGTSAAKDSYENR